jgi:hypothetical protein
MNVILSGMGIQCSCPTGRLRAARRLACISSFTLRPYDHEAAGSILTTGTTPGSLAPHSRLRVKIAVGALIAEKSRWRCLAFVCIDVSILNDGGTGVTAKLWLVGGVVAVLVLALGAFMFFGMLLGLNGFISLQLPILEIYLASLVVTLGLAVWGSVAGAQAAAARTGWSFWLVGPLSVLAAVLGAFVLMLLCAIVLLMVAR